MSKPCLVSECNDPGEYSIKFTITGDEELDGQLCEKHYSLFTLKSAKNFSISFDSIEKRGI